MSNVRTTCLITFAAAIGLAGCGDNKAGNTTAADTTATAPAATAPADVGATAPADPTATPTEAVASTTTTTTTDAAAGGVTYASLTGDAAKGEKVFGQCRTCHVVQQGVNRVGPSLYGVVGRKSGAIEGYKYSVANKNSGYTWTEDQLFTYLEAPQKVMPGTKMAFGGLKKPQDRADVIAYLKTNG